MPGFLLPLIVGGFKVAGDTLLATDKARTGTSESESTATRSGTSTTSPITSPQFDDLSTTLIERLLDNVTDPADLEAIMAEIDKFKSAGLEQVNQLAERISRQAANRSRAQGLGFSSSANFAEAVAGQARTGALSSFLADIARLKVETGLQVPQILGNLRAQEARSGTDLLRTLPIGQETVFNDTTETTATGSSTAPGSALGTFFGSAADQFAAIPGLRSVFGPNRAAPSLPNINQQLPLTQPGVSPGLFKPRFDPFDPDLD